MIFNFRNWVLQTFPFLEDDFDALTDYELFCKMLAYVKKFAKDNEDFNKRLTDLENYINNLDLQDEVNTKLDEMAEDGTLENLIGQYIELMTTYAYNNVAEMKTATNLVNGSFARTSGFYSYNDGGGAYYKIRTITNEDIVDEKSIIALNDNTLIAELIPINNELNFEIFGAKANDENFDNANILLEAIKYCISKRLNLYIPPKTYHINTTIDLNSVDNIEWDFCFKIIGFHEFVSRLQFNNLEYGIKYTGENLKNFTFENLILEFNTKNNNTLLHLENSPYCNFKNIFLKNCEYGIYQTNCWCSNYENIQYRNVDYGLYINGVDNGIVGHGDCLVFKNMNLGNDPTYAGLYLKGCVNVTLENTNLENSTNGNGLIIDSCKNVILNEVYIENFQNEKPIKITSTDFSSLDKIPTNIIINNINAYYCVELIRVEACNGLTINGIFYRNREYNSTPAYNDYPSVISIKDTNWKYISGICINGVNFIAPASVTSELNSFIAYNNLLYYTSLSICNYYQRTFYRGQLIIGNSDEKMYIITDDGTFSSDPTATISNDANSYTGTLSASDNNIFVGMFVNVGSEKARIIKINGTSVTFDRKITNANSNVSITTCNPSYREINLIA